MTINTETLKQAAQNIIAQRDAKLYNDMLSKRNYIKSCCAAIIKQLDAIRAVAPAFNALKTAKIKFVNRFFTDGCDHLPGFSSCRNDVIGVYGTFEPNSVFVNFENEKFIVCHSYAENSSKTIEINVDELVEKYWNDDSVRRYLNRIANGITEFAEAVAEKITTCAR
jgi:hypothetical protein